MQQQMTINRKDFFVLLVEREIVAQRGKRQEEPLHGGIAPPWGAVRSGPAGVPRRGKGRNAPHGGRVIWMPHSSRGSSKERIHCFSWGFPAEAFAWTVIEERLNALKSRFSDTDERTGLRMQPADKPVCVLIRSALPRMVRMSEEDIHARLRCHMFMPGKLLAIVER